MASLISGMIQGIASVVIITLTGGVLGGAKATNSLFLIGESMIKLVGGTGIADHFGKNRVFEVSLPDDLNLDVLIEMKGKSLSVIEGYIV